MNPLVVATLLTILPAEPWSSGQADQPEEPTPFERRAEISGEDLEEAVRADPKDFPSRERYASHLFVAGRPSDARKTFREYYQLIAAEPPDERHWNALYQIYRYSLLMNELDEARPPLETACRLSPSLFAGRAELGLLYYRLGRLDAAAAEFDVVIDAPDTATAKPATRAKAYYYRGIIGQHQGQFDLARSCFEAALALAPKRPEVLRSYGAALRRVGEHEKAREILAEFGQMAALANEAKQLRNAILRNPRQREAHLALIRVLVRLGQRADAERALAALRREFPGDPAIPAAEKQVRDGG